MVADIALERQTAEQHALRRLFQRHGIGLTRREYLDLCAACADGRSPPVAPGRSGRMLHEVAVRGRKVWVVFRADAGVIVTFLPGIPAEVRNAEAWP